MTEDLARLWSKMQHELRAAVPASTYDIWLAPLTAVALDGDRLVVAVPAPMHHWISERFARLLDTCATAILGRGVTVEFRAGDANVRVRDSDGTPVPAAPRSEEARSRAAADLEVHCLNPKYTFDQFVIGPPNRFAHAAALSVAELPGQAYNPLFIYGPPGVGKTHLLHSIGNYIRAYGSGLSVHYTTVETFTNQFVRALQCGAVDRFKDVYRNVGVLLIDDVQFLAAKARTEEEFFHTFNALYDAGSQLVLTSDRVPCDLDGLQDRLRERFQAGLVTDIQPPDRSTRTTVLRKRAAHDQVELDDDDVLELIAERVTHNIGALEGALIRAVAFASLNGRPLDRALTAEVLDGLYPTSASAPGQSSAGPGAGTAVPLTIERIQEATASAFGLERADLLSKSRVASVAWARQLAMYLAREHTEATLPAIGRAFGGRNHTTVLHAWRRAGARLGEDSEAYEAMRRVSVALGVVAPALRADRAD